MTRQSELAHQLRGMIVRGVVSTSNDGGETQTVDVEIAAGHKLTGVEVLQASGVSSRAKDGGLVVLLAVGGDGGDMVALPVADPSGRMGGLEPGEVALYDPASGARVHIKADGSIHVLSATSVTCDVQGNTLEVQPGFVRGRMADGSRFAAAEGLAKIVGGGSHVVVQGGAVIVSTPPVIGPDPSPDI